MKRFHQFLNETLQPDSILRYTQIYDRDIIEYLNDLNDKNIQDSLRDIKHCDTLEDAITIARNIILYFEEAKYDDDLINIMYEDLLEYVYTLFEDGDDENNDVENDIDVGDNPNEMLIKGVVQNNINYVKIAISLGANVKILDKYNNSLIDIAVHHKNIDMVKYLVINGYELINSEYEDILIMVDKKYGSSHMQDFKKWLDLYYDEEGDILLVGMPSGQIIENVDMDTIKYLDSRKYIVVIEGNVYYFKDEYYDKIKKLVS